MSNPKMASAVTLPLSTQFSLVADKTGITYDITISEPKNLLIADVPDPPAALLYVVDAPLNGGLVAGIARNLSLAFPGAQNITPLTVVAVGPRIGTADEMTDYLSKGQRRDLVPQGDPAGDETSAAALFLEFLHRQVDPEVRRRTRVLDEKALLFGHGLSGLFACHALATQHPMFDRYIVLSPTLLDASPTREALVSAPRGQLRGHLYLAISGDDRLDSPQPRLDGAVGRSYHRLAALAGRMHRPHLKAKVQVLRGETFASQIPVALINALRWYLPATGLHAVRMIGRNLPGYFQVATKMIANARKAKAQLKQGAPRK